MTQSATVLRQFARYFLSGSLAVFLHFSMLIFLVEIARENATIATGIGFATGTICNYLMQQSWVFEAKGSHRIFFSRYAAVTALTFLVNLLIFHSALHIAGLHYVASQIIASATVFLINFLINRHYTFRTLNVTADISPQHYEQHK